MGKGGGGVAASMDGIFAYFISILPILQEAQDSEYYPLPFILITTLWGKFSSERMIGSGITQSTSQLNGDMNPYFHNLGLTSPAFIFCLSNSLVLSFVKMSYFHEQKS